MADAGCMAGVPDDREKKLVNNLRPRIIRAGARGRRTLRKRRAPNIGVK